MDTFLSGAVSGLFVTMPSAESTATMRLLDELAALKLDLYRPCYDFREGLCDSPFAAQVMMHIVDEGYAVHRIDDAFRLPA